VAPLHLFYLLRLQLALLAEKLLHGPQLVHHVVVTSSSRLVTSLPVCINFGPSNGALRFLFRPCALQILFELVQFLVRCTLDHTVLAMCCTVLAGVCLYA
jgi:hypothetical protein